MGVCWDPVSLKLYVADSYNNKIKIVDPIAKKCGAFWPTNATTQTLKEPGGIAFACQKEGEKDAHLLFIADTNNHRVLCLDVKSKECRGIDFILEEKLPPEFPLKLPKRGVKEIQLDPLVVEMPTGKERILNFDFQLTFREGMKQTVDATSFWFISSVGYKDEGEISLKIAPSTPLGDRGLISVDQKLNRWRKRIPLRISVSPSPSIQDPLAETETLIHLSYVIFYCAISDGTCAFDAVDVNIPIVFRGTNRVPDNHALVLLKHSVPLH